MKTRILPLSAALLTVLLTAACVKSNTASQVVIPTGNFVGTFTRLHLNIKTNKVDTVKANLTLTMSTSSGFAVSGDTSKHAGSHGSYVVDASGTYLAFSDFTLPSSTSTTTPTKTHLNGVYQYAFSQGVSLQLQAVGDTLAYYYNMKAQ